MAFFGTRAEPYSPVTYFILGNIKHRYSKLAVRKIESLRVPLVIMSINMQKENFFRG